MDFLKIRKKAKERASPRGSAPAGAAAPGDGPRPEAAPEPEEPRGSPPADPPAPVGQVAPAGQSAAAEQVAPADEAAAADPRFTTWRPGSGVRPLVDVPDPGAVAPLAEAAEPEPVRPSRTAPSPLAAPALGTFEAVGPVPAAAPATEVGRDPLDEFFFHEDEVVPALTSLPADAGTAAEAPEDTGVEEYLTFRLGVEEYAVAIERVREVLKSQPVTEVPRAPTGVLGVVTVRGDVVAVFDPRKRLGLPGAPPAEGSGRIVIVDDGEGPCGLLVDAVASVVRLAHGSIEPCPQGIGGASADCLAGIGRERSRLFTVLELGALLRRAPASPKGRPTHAGS